MAIKMKAHTDDDIKPKTRIKIEFYIMSLWLLFALIFMLTINIPISFKSDAKFIGFLPLLKMNWIASLALVMTVVGLLIALKKKREWSGVTNPPYQIVSIKNENYEYLTFLTTYIIPLICIDLSQTRYVIVLVALLLLIGSIFIKTELYYGNPTLALMGYKLYRVEIKGVDSPDGVILISKDRLLKNSSIKWIQIDRYVWIAKEIK